MRAEHDGITRFERDKAFVNRRGRGIGGGQDGRHHSHRDPDLSDLLVRQLAQNADRFHPAHTAGQQVGAEQILGQLVRGVAVAGLLDGQLRQALRFSARRGGHPLDNAIDLLLVKVTVFLPGGVGFFHLGANLLNGNEVFVFEHGL